ncbi:MAG: bifunctional diguanylate cyclase/phosphodiesterase [Acidimicrobiales bacterium]
MADTTSVKGPTTDGGQSPTVSEPPTALSSRQGAFASGIPRPEWCLQGLILALVIAYGVSDIVVHRPPSGYNTIWDGWIYNIAQSLPVIPVLLRVRRSSELRSAWVAIAIGITLITVGNLVYTYHDQNLNPVPDPAPSDAVYLVAYAAFIVGVAMLTQKSFGRVHASVRLDGAITGLSVGALAGMFWFEPLLYASGRPLEIAVNMAYPLCDLVLIVLLAAGLAPHRYRPNWPTVLLMVGVAWFVVGDIVTLNQVAANTYVAGTPLDDTWPLGLFFLGMAASVRDRRRSAYPRSAVSPAGLTVVPVAFGVLSLLVLAASLVRHDSATVLSMAIVALALVIGRMWMTLREVRQSVVNYQDARTDYLTGLANRRAFLERLRLTFFRGEGSALSAGVLLVDLDGFKEVNDALGHAAGDELLCIVAKRFEQRLGNRGILARLGGDEYAFARQVDNENDLVIIAHEFSQALSDPCVIEGTSVRVGASIGCVVADPAGSSPGELLRRADVAMYEAKRAQSGVVVYRTDIDPNSRERLVLLDELRDAIESRAFILHYQPTLDLRTGTVRGVEALVRWEHPSLGLLYPDSFIPLAERYGLMPLLTRAVLDLAAAEGARLERAGQHLEMSVNISRHDLVDEHLADYVDEVLALYNFPHDRLTLEVTESALGGDPERAERCVRELRARGLRISIDDFGVGYSSMSQLLGLAIDELKIDKSFVLELSSDPRAQAIVRSAIEVARALDLTVVAEGIEREDILRSLQGIGADVGQGYVIAYPLTSQQLDAYLAQPDRGSRLLNQTPLLMAGG